MKTQSEIDLCVIRELETKMLPSKDGRSKDESPKVCLTREECLIYADYLEMKGEKIGAAFFRRTDEHGLNKRKEGK